MTLDEAIKHCEEVAESKEKQVKEGAWEKDSNTEKRCIECAKEHRELAEWLKELKELKDFANFVAESVLEEDFEESSDFYAEVFCRKLYKMGFIESIDNNWILNKERINADDGNSN